MDCFEARKIYSIPINQVRPDKLKEATDHIGNCKDCEQYYRNRHKEQLI